VRPSSFTASGDATPMPRRRTKDDGGLGRRHDHPTCPPLGQDGTRPRHNCHGRYYGKLTVVVEGKRRVKYVYGRSQREARIKLEVAKRQRAEGTIVISSRTVEWWMRHWVETIAPDRLKPQTLAGYRSKIETLIVPHLGHRRLDQLQPEHLRLWHKTLRETGGARGQGLADASIRQAHAILRKALADAVRERKLPISPAELMDAPSTRTAERDRLTLEQATVALKAAGEDPRWWLAIFYGMRQGECLGLRWGDVDLEAGTLTIAQTLQMDRGQVTFGPPKTVRSARVLPLLGQVSSRLRLRRPDDVEAGDLVFTHEGGPVKPWIDSRAWHVFLADAGLPKVALHSARNTAADVLEAAGVPARLAAQILGHASVTTTYRYSRAEIAQMTAAFTSSAGVLALEG
jgi:integrase